MEQARGRGKGKNEMDGRKWVCKFYLGRTWLVGTAGTVPSQGMWLKCSIGARRVTIPYHTTLGHAYIGEYMTVGGQLLLVHVTQRIYSCDDDFTFSCLRSHA